MLLTNFINGLIDRVQEHNRQRKDASYIAKPPRAPESISVGDGHTLKDAIDSHHQWMETEGKQGRRLSFDHMDMRNIDFSGTNLTGARMNFCDLRGSKFDDAILEGVGFHDSDLRRASFRGAKCARAQFIDAEMYRADLSEADLSDANFRLAHLEKANFQNANLQRANFRYNILDHADMSGSDLSDARFSWVVMGETDLRGANLSGTVYKQDEFAEAIIDGPMKGQTNAEYHASLETAREQARANIREQMTASLEDKDLQPELGQHDSTPNR